MERGEPGERRGSGKGSLGEEGEALVGGGDKAQQGEEGACGKESDGGTRGEPGR